MRAGYTLAVLGLAILLPGCSGRNHYPDSTKVPAKYKPTINPHPKYFMTVKGFIDPRLNDRIHLTIVAEYDNYNPKCNMWISHLQGASSPWQIFHDYKIKSDSKGSYHIKIPLDYYQPGKCDWHVAYISYVIKDKKHQSDGDTIGSFFKNMYSTKKNDDVPIRHHHTSGSRNIVCSLASCSVKSSGEFLKSRDFISYKQSYHYLLNIVTTN